MCVHCRVCVCVCVCVGVCICDDMRVEFFHARMRAYGKKKKRGKIHRDLQGGEDP